MQDGWGRDTEAEPEQLKLAGLKPGLGRGQIYTGPLLDCFSQSGLLTVPAMVSPEAELSRMQLPFSLEPVICLSS